MAKAQFKPIQHAAEAALPPMNVETLEQQVPVIVSGPKKLTQGLDRRNNKKNKLEVVMSVFFLII